MTPLYVSCLNGHVEIARLLLAARAAVNGQKSNGAAHALHAAASMGSLQVMRLLLTQKADPNAAKTDGWTPLSLAAWHGHAGCVAVLIEARDLDLLVEDGRHRMALHCAFEGGDPAVVSALLAAYDARSPRWAAQALRGADDRGWTPIHIAARARHAADVDHLRTALARVGAAPGLGLGDPVFRALAPGEKPPPKERPPRVGLLHLAAQCAGGACGAEALLAILEVGSQRAVACHPPIV